MASQECYEVAGVSKAFQPHARYGRQADGPGIAQKKLSLPTMSTERTRQVPVFGAPSGCKSFPGEFGLGQMSTQGTNDRSNGCRAAGGSGGLQAGFSFPLFPEGATR